MKARAIILSSLALSIIAGGLVAGPLTPAAGPVAPTFKTLSDVEPRTAINAATTPGDADHVFVIMQPGSYYLSGNINVPAGKTAIGVYASNVTIDLNGFTISGGVEGINGSAPGSDASITIRNGTLRGGTGYGLGLSGLGKADLQDVSVMGYSGAGALTGAFSHVARCTFSRNGQAGLLAGQGSIVDRCLAEYNAEDGIHSSSSARVTGCISQYNSGHGYSCAGSGVVFSGCSAMANTGNGFTVTERSTLERCTSTSNSSRGFEGLSTCIVKGCAAFTNGWQGIVFTDKASVIDCEARANGQSGTYAGIYINGSGGRVENCVAIDNDYGVYITGNDNIVVKNSCRANSSGNFTIPANNEAAPVITNPGSNGFATMTPWSNVAY